MSWIRQYEKCQSCHWQNNNDNDEPCKECYNYDRWEEKQNDSLLCGIQNRILFPQYSIQPLHCQPPRFFSSPLVGLHILIHPGSLG